jgi:hypothetical protein
VSASYLNAELTNAQKFESILKIYWSKKDIRADNEVDSIKILGAAPARTQVRR